MLNLKIVCFSLRIFSALSFVLCVIYGLIVPPAFHSAALLERILPGFMWLTLGAFCLGLVESLLYGTYVGFMFVPVYNFLNRRWEGARPDRRLHVVRIDQLYRTLH